MSVEAERVAALAVDDLRVEFPGDAAPVVAANGVSFAVEPGRTLGIVGESGCGKSATIRAACGLVPSPGRHVGGTVTVEGRTCSTPDELAELRGRTLAMIFQDPGSSLNPVMTIGQHLREVLEVVLGHSRRSARAEAVALLDHVGIPSPASRLSHYPHELSGGMRQRVMIALAVAARARVLLADEPTTALDVTTQEQILQLLKRLQRETGMALVLVTHDLGVVEEVCDDVIVMYAGYVVERGTADAVTLAPRHPYTRGLVAAMPRLFGRELPRAIPGQPPDMDGLPPGCPFAPRCASALPDCLAVDMARESVTDCACPFAADSTSPASRGEMIAPR